MPMNMYSFRSTFGVGFDFHELPTGEAAISSPYFITHRFINITSEEFFVTSHFCSFLLSDYVKNWNDLRTFSGSVQNVFHAASASSPVWIVLSAARAKACVCFPFLKVRFQFCIRSVADWPSSHAITFSCSPYWTASIKRSVLVHRPSGPISARVLISRLLSL